MLHGDKNVHGRIDQAKQRMAAQLPSSFNFRDLSATLVPEKNISFMVQTPENAIYMLLDQVQLGQFPWFKEPAQKLTKQVSNRTWDEKEYDPKVGESQPGY